MTGQEITNTEDYLTMATYLTEIYNNFKGEIPHIKHPKLVSSYVVSCIYIFYCTKYINKQFFSTKNVFEFIFVSPSFTVKNPIFSFQIYLYIIPYVNDTSMKLKCHYIMY